MSLSEMNERGTGNEFTGINEAYLEELYDRFLANPTAVASEVRAFFESHGHPSFATSATPAEIQGFDPTKVAAAAALSTAIRMYGYREAQLDPLHRPPPGDIELLPEKHGISAGDLAAIPAGVVGGPVAKGAASALEAITTLRSIYQGTSGYEFEHVSDADERLWLRLAVETGRYRPPNDPIDDRALLQRLARVESFERFLQTSFPTQTRFSLEGLDMLVPMLDELCAAAAEAGTRQVMLGMAHRGRLNVLAHVLGKPYAEIFAEFQGSFQLPNVSESGSGGRGWTGDVKYHRGARKAYRSGREVGMIITLAPNPSHLEFIDPVLEGMTRAASELRDEAGPAQVDQATVLAILIHGEAAFVGEGVTAETLNLSRLPGYGSGGTIHLIANNQVGFTTPPELGRSTLFASDLAKGFEIPVIHVNADDPEACIAAIRLAHSYVTEFHKDVVIDTIGYRRMGHNEGDEPSFTQPTMYKIIAEHPTARALWAEKLEQQGRVTQEESSAILREVTDRLQAIRQSLPKEGLASVIEEQAGREAGGVAGGLGHAGVAAEIDTAVRVDELVRLNEEMLRVPEEFHLHQKLRALYERRAKALYMGDGKEGHIDWAHGEALAFASILNDSTPIRLSGQDVSRGTFSQRHSMLRDVVNGAVYVPLQHIPSAKAAFEVWDSPLSEQAALGFEFGYNVQAPDALVLWEAQYGDFVDAAQVIVDTFVVSGRTKWGEAPSIVLLLPQGYEGQGPEHSSARLERFLQMAAEDNLRIANCTTAAQYFHILRRQAQLLKLDPRPLVLLTPKSLLRHPLASSPISAFTAGRFQAVIDDVEARQSPALVRRLVLCSGRVHVDLVSGREGATNAREAAIVRVEELYPFPATEIERVVEGYPQLREVIWVQEEPRNMGGWTFVAPRLRDLLRERLPLSYVGRTRRASPAEGSYEWHAREQQRLVEAVFPHMQSKEHYQS